MGSDKSRINLVVNEERKSQWKEYQDENPEFQSLTDLIRTSVTRQMEGQYSPSESGEAELKVSEAIDKIDRLSEQVSNVETRLKNVENQAIANPEIDRLKGEVYDLLPDEEPGSTMWEKAKTGLGQSAAQDSEYEPKVIAWDGTPEKIAEALEEPTYLVEEALETLYGEVPTVKKTNDRRYYLDR